MPELDTAPRPTTDPTPCRRVLDLLAEEGYRPHLREGDGPWHTIDFKSEGYLFLVRVCDADPDFVQVTLGFRFDEPAPDPDAALRAGHEVQSRAKVAKFFLDPDADYYELQAELFLGGEPFRSPHLERSLVALRRAAADFQERLRVEAPRARA